MKDAKAVKGSGSGDGVIFKCEGKAPLMGCLRLWDKVMDLGDRHMEVMMVYAIMVSKYNCMCINIMLGKAGGLCEMIPSSSS